MAEYPRTTKQDIEDSVPISIVGKVVDGQVFDDGNELYRLRDPDGAEIDLKIWSAEADRYAIETDTWYLFEDAEGDVYQGEQNLGSNQGSMTVETLESPPAFVNQAQDDGQVDDATDGGVVALDIETISTVPERQVDLENSDHLELLCIGVGWAPTAGAPGRSDVLFREGTGPESEARLLRRFCEYVESADPDQLVLFKGDFDMMHLRGRAKRVADEDGIHSRVTELFETYEVVNLDPLGSLETNAEVRETYWDIYQHSLSPADWRQDHPRYSGDVADPTVTNKDIPYFGERYLELSDEGATGHEYRALHELIRHYTVADIDPLFEMI
jgi:hypothetical protein